MDLSFSFRGRKHGVTDTPDLESLLSQAAARAAVTMTARIAARLDVDEAAVQEESHIALFAEGKPCAPKDGRFASLPQTPVTDEQ